MSDTKISEAAVEAACSTSGITSRAAMRAALDAAFPHLHPQPVELAEQQGVREQFEAWARKFGHDLTRRSIGCEGDDSYSDDFALYAWNAWQAALAATGKQQVGEVQGDALAVIGMGSHVIIAGCGATVIGLDPYSPRLEIEWDAPKGGKEYRHRQDIALAARQPVAQVPVLYQMWHSVDRWDQCTKEEHEDWQRRGGGHTSRALYASPIVKPVTMDYVKGAVIIDGTVTLVQKGDELAWARGHVDGRKAALLYATPPAQGIDLGQLWEQAHAAMREHRKGNRSDCFVLDCLKGDVQKLIDQRDAAPGVGS